MLKALHIKNVVLIEQLSLSLEGGLCALTGETGAGKSILLDSLGLALGQRSDAGLVRKGAEKASVSAAFELPDLHPLYNMMKAHDLELEETLILRRVVNKDGRSRAFVNDQPVSVSLLKEIGAALVEIHGQFETQGLLNPKTHRALLDSYAGLQDMVGRLDALWKAWKLTRKEFEEAQAQAIKNRQEEEYLRQSVEDLDALDPQEGEEQKLSDVRERLKHRESLVQALHMSREAVFSENGAEDIVHQAYRALERVADKGGQAIEAVMNALDRALAELQEAGAEIDSVFADMEEGEQSLEAIDDRLYALRAQARKHNCTVDALASVKETLSRQLALIDNEEGMLSDLARKCDEARDSYVSLAQEIHEKRKKVADSLDQKVGQELPPLKLEKARFKTEIRAKEEADWNAQGLDDVRFLVSTNPGTEPAPLNKIASGGEMSRFMLALKVVIAESDTAGSYVFDEVDSGIGGATADAVGERLSRLAKHHQILVVTHSPQVAARADHHWIVKKDGTKEVRTNIITLENYESRREEIARMLSGADVTQEARAAAEKLLETGA